MGRFTHECWHGEPALVSDRSTARLPDCSTARPIDRSIARPLEERLPGAWLGRKVEVEVEVEVELRLREHRNGHHHLAPGDLGGVGSIQPARRRSTRPPPGGDRAGSRGRSPKGGDPTGSG
jgi:hypothetical protein